VWQRQRLWVAGRAHLLAQRALLVADQGRLVTLEADLSVPGLAYLWAHQASGAFHTGAPATLASTN